MRPLACAPTFNPRSMFPRTQRCLPFSPRLPSCPFRSRQRWNPGSRTHPAALAPSSRGPKPRQLETPIWHHQVPNNPRGMSYTGARSSVPPCQIPSSCRLLAAFYYRSRSPALPSRCRGTMCPIPVTSQQPMGATGFFYTVISCSLPRTAPTGATSVNPNSARSLARRLCSAKIIPRPLRQFLGGNGSDSLCFTTDCSRMPGPPYSSVFPSETRQTEMLHV